MAEESKKSFVRREREKRPAWSMDVMILANLNDISKYIDEAAVRVYKGDLNGMVEWKAGLHQFYNNIKNYFDEKLTELTEDGFDYLDRMISPVARELPKDRSEMKKIIKVMENMNQMFYHARNELFMKFVEIMSPTEKATRYAFSALPDDELEEKIREREGDKNEDNYS